MRDSAKTIGLKTFSPSLVQDLCALDQGGEVLAPSSYEQAVRTQVYERTSEIDEKLIEQETEKLLAYHQRVADFLKTLEVENTPGESPLERALNTLKILQNQHGDAGSGSGEGEPLPVFQDGEGGEVAEGVNELIESIDQLDESEAELLEAPGEGVRSERQKRAIATDMTAGKQTWLRISRELDKKASFRASKSRKVREDLSGEERLSRQIKTFNEVGRLAKQEFAHPRRLFNYRLATKQSVVKMRAVHEEKKQLLYLLVDCSGSMDNSDRIEKATGVVFNRLKAVIQGEAEVYLRFFDGDLHEEYFAGDLSQAKKLMDVVQEGSYSGGSTSFDTALLGVQTHIDEIVTKGVVDRPQIVIVTDGDDWVSVNPEDLKQTIVHSFLVDGCNEGLRRISDSTGGIYIQL